MATRTCADPPRKIRSNRLDKALFIDGSNNVRPTGVFSLPVGLALLDPPYGYGVAAKSRTYSSTVP
jgi:hypothetical protein